MNTLRTTFLMVLLTVLLVMAGGALGGEGGMVMAFLFALVMNGNGWRPHDPLQHPSAC